MADMNIKSDDANELCCGPDGDRSPTIYLNDDQCEALGIKGQPKPGTVYELKVKAVVTRVTATSEEKEEAKTEGDKPDLDVTLRLADIEIVATLGKSAAETLYE